MFNVHPLIKRFTPAAAGLALAACASNPGLTPKDLDNALHASAFVRGCPSVDIEIDDQGKAKSVKLLTDRDPSCMKLEEIKAGMFAVRYVLHEGRDVLSAPEKANLLSSMNTFVNEIILRDPGRAAIKLATMEQDFRRKFGFELLDVSVVAVTCIDLPGRGNFRIVCSIPRDQLPKVAAPVQSKPAPTGVAGAQVPGVS